VEIVFDEHRHRIISPNDHGTGHTWLGKYHTVASFARSQTFLRLIRNFETQPSNRTFKGNEDCVRIWEQIENKNVMISGFSAARQQAPRSATSANGANQAKSRNPLGSDETERGLMVNVNKLARLGKGQPSAPEEMRHNLGKPPSGQKVHQQVKISSETRRAFRVYAATTEHEMELGALFGEMWRFYQAHHG
jgi:hypothetical protein